MKNIRQKGHNRRRLWIKEQSQTEPNIDTETAPF